MRHVIVHGTTHFALLYYFLYSLKDVSFLREVFRVLGLMKIDMVNFTVQTLRPHLMQQAVQYERAKFQQILDKDPGEKGLWV